MPVAPGGGVVGVFRGLAAFRNDAPERCVATTAGVAPVDNAGFRPAGDAPVTRSPLSPVRLAAALLALGALTAPALAQDAKPVAKPPAAKPQAGAAKAAPCPQGQTCPKGGTAPRRAATPPPTTAAQMAELPHADEEQRQAASLVHYGKYVCDEKFEVFVEPNPVFTGYVDVRYKRDVWVMKPVASRTGAVRLEDTRGKVLLVQIPFKSMLLNTQTGQRIVDSCQHDVQRSAETEAKASAPPAQQ